MENEFCKVCEKWNKANPDKLPADPYHDGWFCPKCHKRNIENMDALLNKLKLTLPKKQ